MQQLGLIRNRTTKDQSWGSYEIAAGAVGCVPLEVVTSLRARPVSDFEVVDDDAEPRLVRHTEHQPWGVRYQR